MKSTNNIQFGLILIFAMVVSLIRLTLLFVKIDIGMLLDVTIFISSCISTFLICKNGKNKSLIILLLNCMSLTILSIIMYEISRFAIAETHDFLTSIINRLLVSLNVFLIFSLANIIVISIFRYKTKSKFNKDLIDYEP